MAAGLSAEIAINTINSVLMVRSETETFSTVDLALVDLGTGRVELVKIGAAPSFIKRGPNVTVVKSATVPLGIVDHVQIEPETRTMRPGDFLIMLTDGIWDVAKSEEDKERWIIQHLQRESSVDPEEIAERLLARALEISPDAGDDMTVLVARIDPISELKDLAEIRSQVSGDWIAARQAPRFQSDVHSR
jgi:stage II sporulation protein E